MTKYIECESLLDALCYADAITMGGIAIINQFPAADVRPAVRAKWEDVHIDRPEIADLEVASMFCPNCNRWHNRVYHYGNPIDFENFCSFCGADMREESKCETNMPKLVLSSLYGKCVANTDLEEGE